MGKKDVPRCPHCGANNVKKNGFTPKNKQRFYCNRCKKTFTGLSRLKISKEARQVLGILYNLLDNDFYDSESLQQALYDACLEKKELNINDVYYDGCLDRHKEQGSHLRYTCYNPKLIVCVENNKLKLYKIYPANKNTKYKSRNIVINEQLYDP